MTFSISQPNGGDVVRVTFEGLVDFRDVMGAVDLLSPGGVFSCGNRFYDFRGCRLELSSAELRTIGRIGQERETERGTVAVLVDRDVDFGQVRQHAAYRDPDRTKLNVFRDEEEALAWLAEGSDT